MFILRGLLVTYVLFHSWVVLTEYLYMMLGSQAATYMPIPRANVLLRGVAWLIEVQNTLPVIKSSTYSD